MQKSDHPAVPITKDEIVTCAQACYSAGAGSIHAHIRDENGQHLLDAATYRDLVAAIHALVPDMAVQITTEAAGLYEPAHQMKVALEAGAHSVSVSIREITRADPNEVRQFINACGSKEITLQFILYDRDDADLLARTLKNEELQNPNLQLLFVLGCYGKEVAKPDDLDVFTSWMTEHSLNPDWAVCAFGHHEPECLRCAATLGGKCRTGFENAMHLSTGLIAPDNAAKVRDVQRILKD